MKLFFDNSDQHVSCDGAPDLRFYRVLAVADKMFDTQMLFDPFEEHSTCQQILYSAAS
mgnify:CR=1 FL=1